MSQTQIGFIGSGNMATSLIGGLIADGWPADSIHASDPDSSRREALSSQFSIHTHEDNETTAMAADVLVLAVKPQMMQAVASALATSVQQKQPVVISIAAGITLDVLSGWLSGYRQLVRTMPNTPALVQSGATALYAMDAVSEEQRDQAETIMRAVGLSLWVDNEALMDAVTAISGSGPAYFFYMMEAMQQTGIKLGLNEEQARILSIQTAFGAAKMALESPDDPTTLRHKVTSPGGTTERAINTMDEHAVAEHIQQAIEAACERSRELASILGQQS